MHSPIAAARAKVGGAGRTAAETPGSARLLDNEFYLDKLLHTAAASGPPAPPSHGRAYRTCREQRYGPIDHY